MKTKLFIYGSIFLIFVTFITYYLTESPLIEEFAIWAAVIFLAIMSLFLVVLPIYSLFKPKEGTVTIKKGRHRSGFRLTPFIYKKKMKFRVRFKPSCVYTGSTQLEEQINKCAGFGSWFVHNRSLRLGWNYNSFTKKIDLYLYEYIKGDRQITYLQSVDINTYNDITLKSEKPYWFGTYYKFYFGGKEPAPHNVEININYL